MRAIPNFSILVHLEGVATIIRDDGPWDQHPTVTNGAEEVVAALSSHISSGERLFYFDSEDVPTELVVSRGRFDGYTNVKDVVNGAIVVSMRTLNDGPMAQSAFPGNYSVATSSCAMCSRAIGFNADACVAVLRSGERLCFHRACRDLP